MVAPKRRDPKLNHLYLEEFERIYFVQPNQPPRTYWSSPKNIEMLKDGVLSLNLKRE